MLNVCICVLYTDMYIYIYIYTCHNNNTKNPGIWAVQPGQNRCCVCVINLLLRIIREFIQQFNVFVHVGFGATVENHEIHVIIPKHKVNI